MRFLIALCALLLIALVLFAVGCERKVVNESGGDLIADATVCFSCHGDQDRDLVAAQAQWAVSKHGSGDNIDRNRLNSANYASCEKCHSSEGFLAGLKGTTATGEYFTPIGCFTCHEPHTSGNLGVRVTQAVALPNGEAYDRGQSNLCASCHQSRVNAGTYVVDGVSINNRWGPHHSNQADMLSGTNGYEYAGYDYDNSPHSNVTADGCVDCHMSASGDITLGGHSWKMADDKGHYNRTGCNLAQCHDGDFASNFDFEADADFDWDGEEETVQEEIHGLLDSLEVLLVNAGLLRDGLPTSVTVSEADSAGAIFNYLFVEEDRSEGVHNTEYAVGLLRSSINYLATGTPEKMPAIQEKKAFLIAR